MGQGVRLKVSISEEILSRRSQGLFQANLDTQGPRAIEPDSKIIMSRRRAFVLPQLKLRAMPGRFTTAGRWMYVAKQPIPPFADAIRSRLSIRLLSLGDTSRSNRFDGFA